MFDRSLNTLLQKTNLFFRLQVQKHENILRSAKNSLIGFNVTFFGKSMFVFKIQFCLLLRTKALPGECKCKWLKFFILDMVNLSWHIKTGVQWRFSLLTAFLITVALFCWITYIKYQTWCQIAAILTEQKYFCQVF